MSCAAVLLCCCAAVLLCCCAAVLLCCSAMQRYDFFAICHQKVIHNFSELIEFELLQS
jgi:hypothetical protein